MRKISPWYLALFFALLWLLSPIVAHVAYADDLVVGGDEAEPHAWPWMVAVTSDSGRCGGVLLSRNWAITAAHCVERAAGATLGFGAHDRTQPEVERVAHLILIHPERKSVTKRADIALLYFDAITYTASIQPAELYTPTLEAGEPVTVAGWGALSEGGASSNMLHQAALQVSSWRECADTYAGIVTLHHVCTNVPGMDACYGDSGGPLHYEKRVAALVSFGYGCARDAWPGVYLRVAPYYQWIQYHIDSTVYAEPIYQEIATGGNDESHVYLSYLPMVAR